MTTLQNIEAFVRCVELGGFSAAGRTSCTTIGAVSAAAPTIRARVPSVPSGRACASAQLVGSGTTVRIRLPLPEPPLSGSPFSTFLLLPPVVAADRHLFDNLHLHGQGVEPLAVHLVSDAEYDLVRSDEGLDVFLDLLDVHRYPLVFDPARPSYL